MSISTIRPECRMTSDDPAINVGIVHQVEIVIGNRSSKLKNVHCTKHEVCLEFLYL